MSLRLNYIFNFIGGAWTAVLGILFVPIYLRFVGVEAYGIIGFFTSLQALFFLLDLGLSPAFNREVARHSASSSVVESSKLRDLTRTLASVNIVIAIIIGVSLCLVAPIIANYWVNASTLSVSDVSQSFMIMAVGSALQFPIAFYLSGLAGMQRQVASNIVQIIFGTLRSVGALAVLAYYSPTLQAFLIWQALITFAQMLVIAKVFYAGLPKTSGKARFDREILKKIWRFAAGNTAISLTAILLTQTDKIVLSRLLTLESFGYYSLAGMISITALVMLANSVAKVAFPEFSALVSNGDSDRLKHAFHKNAQFVTVLVVPAAAVLATFSKEILLVWTRSPLIAEEGHILLTLLAIATGLNCVAWIPYYAQLAHGWTRLTFFFNVFAVLALLLLLLYFVPRFGAAGGALSFLLIQFGYLTLYAALMFRRILTGEMFNWLFRDLLIPSVVVAIIVFSAAFFVSGATGTLPILASLSMTTVAAYMGAAITAGFVRERVVSSIQKTLGSPKLST